MDEAFIRNRITQLRLKKGVSEYKMSIDLGHSKSYIQSISSGRSLPSLSEFLYICDYLGITPKSFFDDGVSEPILVQEIFNRIADMENEDLLVLLALIDRLKKK